MEHEGPQKICVICGIDCAGRPRIKDPKGRYYCRSCHGEAVRKKEPAEAAPSAPHAAHRVACTNCGTALPHDAVICMQCGYNAATGAPVELNTAGESWLLWPVDMYFRPDRFFRSFAEETPLVLIAAFAWLFGMAGVIDRIDARMAMADLTGRPFALVDAWPVHWAVIAVMGVLLALLYVAIGGWWYRVRLTWCGAGKPDIMLVRRVYILASFVWAMPFVLCRGIMTALYNTPGEAFRADLSIMDLLIVVFLFWSYWTSFRGVRTVFETKRVRAILWFLVIPAGVHAFILTAAMAIGVLAGLAGSLFPPDVQNPQRFGSQTMGFNYPGNWWLDEDPTLNPDYDVIVEAMQDAMVQVSILPPGAEISMQKSGTLAFYTQGNSRLRQQSDFSTWGSLRGEGSLHTGTMDGDPCRLLLFYMQAEDGRLLQVSEIYVGDDAKMVEPGFALIRDTFWMR